MSSATRKSMSSSEARNKDPRIGASRTGAAARIKATGRIGAHRIKVVGRIEATGRTRMRDGAGNSLITRVS